MALAVVLAGRIAQTGWVRGLRRGGKRTFRGYQRKQISILIALSACRGIAVGPAKPVRCGRWREFCQQFRSPEVAELCLFWRQAVSEPGGDRQNRAPELVSPALHAAGLACVSGEECGPQHTL